MSASISAQPPKWISPTTASPVDSADCSARAPHVEAALGACQALIEHNIPWGVITREDLGRLNRHQVIVLPDVLMMDAEECNALRDYVRAGGRLYASGHSSLVTRGRQLSRTTSCWRMSSACVMRARRSRPSPTSRRSRATSRSSAPGAAATRPASRSTSCASPRCREAEVIAELVLPWTNPADPWRFASIHNNPPGRYTGRPAIVRNRLRRRPGDLPSVGAIERKQPPPQLFVNLLQLMGPTWSLESNAPKPVEITLFHQPEERRWLINLVNFQQSLPNLPVRDLYLQLRLPADGDNPSLQPQRLLQLPEGPRACAGTHTGRPSLQSAAAGDLRNVSAGVRLNGRRSTRWGRGRHDYIEDSDDLRQ